MTPPAPWSPDELARRALLEQGIAVAVNLRRHGNLIAWAKERGLFVRVDRATPWGNPFVIGRRRRPHDYRGEARVPDRHHPAGAAERC